jgi:hypothetical protein
MLDDSGGGVDWYFNGLLEAAHKAGKKILPIYLPGTQASLERLPSSLAWFSDFRGIPYDRARVASLVDDITAAFGVRARATNGPGLPYLLLMILLAALCGMLYIDSVRKESAHEQAKRDLDQAKADLSQARREIESERRAVERLERELQRTMPNAPQK